MAFKKNLFLAASLGVLVVASLATIACGPAYVGVRGGGDDVGFEVGVAPPGLQAEVAIDSPGPGYAWVPGYYDWNNGSYAWVAGRWTRPPHEGAVWVAPRYEDRGSKHMYYRGHWRNDDHRDHHDEHHG